MSKKRKKWRGRDEARPTDEEREDRGSRKKEVKTEDMTKMRRPREWKGTSNREGEAEVEDDAAAAELSSDSRCIVITPEHKPGLPGPLAQAELQSHSSASIHSLQSGKKHFYNWGQRDQLIDLLCVVLLIMIPISLCFVLTHRTKSWKKKKNARLKSRRQFTAALWEKDRRLKDSVYSHWHHPNICHTEAVKPPLAFV